MFASESCIHNLCKTLQAFVFNCEKSKNKRIHGGKESIIYKEIWCLKQPDGNNLYLLGAFIVKIL